MPGINQATVSDDYSAAATVQDVFTSTGGWFSVASHAVVVQLQWGPNASGSRWSEEQTLGSGAFGTIPPGCTGIRFKNLVAGSSATVTAYIGSGGPPPDQRANVWPEPALAISAIGSVTTSGIAPTQTVISAAGAGTYNTPAGCIALLVECIGAGGAGGTAVATGAGQASCGGGGGGGGYAASIIGSPSASYAVNVGAAPGGNTTFGTAVQATGGGNGSGAAGAPPLAAAGAAGGAGSTGTVQIAGEAGQAGYVGAASASANYGGGGGSAARGGGGGAVTVSLGSNGNAGRSPGGGGAGGSNGQSAVQHVGGAGANGMIIVTEFY